MKRKNKSAFTLVELIIVVVIIAILATIAFITLGQYPQEARDVKRLSDKNNIEKALEIYRAQKGSYPKFDIYEGKTVFGTGALNELNGTISTLPRDPLTKKPYTIQLQENQVDRTTTARVIIEAGESRYTNGQLAQNGGTTNPTTTVTPPVSEPENNLAYTGEPDKTTCDRSSHGRFTVNGQVITDTKTGLVWSKETVNFVNLKDWQQAKQYCENLTTGGKTNWRLPDITELRSITNKSCYGPATYSEFDGTVASNLYWSSTTNAHYTDGAGVLNFDYSFTYWDYKTDSNYVLCVAK